MPAESAPTAASIARTLVQKYTKNTPKKAQLIDAYLAYVLLTGIIQFVYCVCFGSFPYNSFLAGFISCVGSFAIAASLRIQLMNPSDFDSPPERLYADFVFCHLILHFVVLTFMG